MNNIPSITIESIKFKNGNDELGFNNDDIVLLVGANNAGKSRTLKDLQEDLMNEDKPKVLIDSVRYKPIAFTPDSLRNYFERNTSKEDDGSYNVSARAGTIYCYDALEFEDISDANIKRFYKVLFSFLSTENRLSITRPIRFNTQVDNNALNIRKKNRGASRGHSDIKQST